MIKIEFKEEGLKDEIFKVTPVLLWIVLDMSMWVTAHGYDFVVTDILSEYHIDKKLGRVSSTHADGRAIDIRVRDWPIDFRKKFEQYFENKYPNDGAISLETKKHNLVYIHDNGIGGIHAHIQVKRS